MSIIEILQWALFWAQELMVWATMTAACSGSAFMVLDMYIRREEINNTILLRQANALLKEVRRNDKHRVTA